MVSKDDLLRALPMRGLRANEMNNRIAGRKVVQEALSRLAPSEGGS